MKEIKIINPDISTLSLWDFFIDRNSNHKVSNLSLLDHQSFKPAFLRL